MSTFGDQLLQETIRKVVSGSFTRLALIGHTPEAIELMAGLTARGLGQRVLGIFDPRHLEGEGGLPQAWSRLAVLSPDLLVVCADREKEDLLRACLETTAGHVPVPDVVLAGMSHMEFRDPLYEELDRPAMVPSYATGYPYTRVHLFQCLQAASARGLSGAVVELGSFKGGTTAWLARVVRHLGLDARVIGFDAWTGFPARRSVLDLYTHPRCVFSDLDSVRAYLEPLGVELVVGDIADTAPERLHDEPILCAFVDTDNYSGSSAALRAIVPNLVPGGAVVFDHYWTTADYLYTIGERMAGQEVLLRAGLLQIHGTGVFIKI